MRRNYAGPEQVSSSTIRLFERRISELDIRRAPGRLHFAGKGFHELLPGHTDVDGRNPHVAGRHEFVFAVSGKARIDTPDMFFELTRGDLLLIEPGVPHAERPPDRSSSYVLCWIDLDKSYVTISHTSIQSEGQVSMLGPAIQLEGRTNVQSIGVAIASEFTSKAWGWTTAIQGLLQYLRCILMRRIRLGHGAHLGPTESPMIAQDPATWNVVQDALQYCRANFDHRLRVEDVARAVGYSSSRLSHLFSAYLGQSLAEHVRSLRMARARHLLEATDLTVSQVARRVGYGDPAHFSRAFKRAERLSPSAYRERLRGH